MDNHSLSIYIYSQQQVWLLENVSIPQRHGMTYFIKIHMALLMELKQQYIIVSPTCALY